MLFVWLYHKMIDRISLNFLWMPNEFLVSGDYRCFFFILFNSFILFLPLAKIRGGQLVGEIRELAQKVFQLAREEQDYQEALVDPPDEFLDPIMSTLMLGKAHLIFSDKARLSWRELDFPGEKV